MLIIKLNNGLFYLIYCVSNHGYPAHFVLPLWSVMPHCFSDRSHPADQSESFTLWKMSFLSISLFSQSLHHSCHAAHLRPDLSSSSWSSPRAVYELTQESHWASIVGRFDWLIVLHRKLKCSPCANRLKGIKGTVCGWPMQMVSTTEFN